MGMYPDPAAHLKEFTLLVNSPINWSYDYVSKDGSDWLGHVTIGYTITNYYIHWATQYLV